MTTEKPKGMYHVLSKSRAMYRGNPLLTLDHLQFFKPVEVPVDVLVQNRCVKETITVNPLTGIVEVSGIALFSTDRLRNEKYKEDHRVWVLSSSAKEYLKQVTGNEFERVVSYHDTKRVAEKQKGNTFFNRDVMYTTPLIYNSVFTADKLRLLPSDEIVEYNLSYIQYKNFDNNLNDFNPYRSTPARTIYNQTKILYKSYNDLLNGRENSVPNLGNVPFIISRDIVVMADMLDKFMALDTTKVYQDVNYKGETTLKLKYTPMHLFNDFNINGIDELSDEILNNNANIYVDSTLPHGGMNLNNNTYTFDNTTSFLQFVPYKYQFTLKDTDIVTFYLDLVAGKLWNKPGNPNRTINNKPIKEINVNDEKYNRVALNYLNKEYSVNSSVSDTINCVYPSSEENRTNYKRTQNFLDDSLQYNNNNNSNIIHKKWVYDNVYRKSIPIKGVKIDGKVLTLSDIRDNRYDQIFFKRNKNIVAILPDDSEVNLYKYLTDNDMIPTREHDGEYITLGLKDEGDLPTLISYRFTAYPKWWQLVWSKNYRTPAFSSYEQFNYFYKDAEWLTDTEKELYQRNGKDVFVKPRKLGPNELLVVLPKSGAKFLGQNVEHNGLLPGDTTGLFYRHNIMAVANEMNDFNLDNLTFGSNHLSYEDAVIELVYGNWYKHARFDEQKDSPSNIIDLRNHVDNPDALLSTITFNNIDMPWWGTISLWYPTDDGRTSSPRFVRSFIDNAREMGLSPTEFWLLISLAFIHGYRTRWVEVKPSLFNETDLIPTLKQLGNNNGQYFKTYMTGVITDNVSDVGTRTNLINKLNNGEVDTSYACMNFSYTADKYIFNFGIDPDESAGTYIPQQRVLNYYWIQSHSENYFGGSVYSLKDISTPLTTYNFNSRFNTTANHNIKNNISVGEPSIYAYNSAEATNKALTGYEVGHHSMFGTFGHRYLNLRSANSNEYTNIVSYIRDIMVTSGKYLTMDILDYSWMYNLDHLNYSNKDQFKLMPGYSGYWGYLNDTAKTLAAQLKLFNESGVDYSLLRYNNDVNGITGVDDTFKVDDTDVYLTVPLSQDKHVDELSKTGGYGDTDYKAPVLKCGLHLNGSNSIVNLYLSAFYASRLRVRVGLAKPDLPIWDKRDNEIHKADMKMLGYDLDKYNDWLENYTPISNITSYDKNLDQYIELILTPDKHGIYNFLKCTGGKDDTTPNTFGDELRGSVNIFTNDKRRFGAHLDNYNSISRDIGGDYNKYLPHGAKDNLDSYLSESGLDIRSWNAEEITDIDDLKGVYFKGMEEYNNILYRHMYGMQALPVLWGCVNDSEDPSKSVYNQYLTDINKINTDYQHGSKVYPLMYNQLSSTYHLNNLSGYHRNSLLYNNPESPFIRRVYNNYIYSTYKGGYGLTLAPYIWSTYNVDGKGYDYRLRYQHVTSLGAKNFESSYNGDGVGSRPTDDLINVIDRMDVNHRIHNSLDVAASWFKSESIPEDERGLDISNDKYKADKRSVLSTNSVFTPSILGGFLSAWTVQTIVHYGITDNFTSYGGYNAGIINNLGFIPDNHGRNHFLHFNTTPDINSGRSVNESRYYRGNTLEYNKSMNITNNINYDKETLAEYIGNVYKRVDSGNDYKVRIDSPTDLIGTIIYTAVKNMFGLPASIGDEYGQLETNTLVKLEDYQVPLVIEIDALYESTEESANRRVPNVDINSELVPSIGISDYFTDNYYSSMLIREVANENRYNEYKKANWVNVHREYIDLNKYIEFTDNE